MNKFILLSNHEQREVFQSVSGAMGLRPEIIEKDFWVCFMLDHLFNKCIYKDAFVFKGGTSLSKVYHVIKRFSEDIDIILDWRKVLNKDEIPWADRSNTQQDQFNKKLNAKAALFYKEKLVPHLNDELERRLGKGQWVTIDEDDEMVINFFYPQLFEVDYLRDKLRLEIGPLAEWVPCHVATVKSFVADVYPKLFDNVVSNVLTIDVERTFWEKITILHKMANYPVDKALPLRYARHLYDVYCMIGSDVKNTAFERKDLLEKDIAFKRKFYYSKNAHYESAILSKVKIVPAGHILEDLKSDYSLMRNMIYGDYPSFEMILEGLRLLQDEIHELEG